MRRTRPAASTGGVVSADGVLPLVPGHREVRTGEGEELEPGGSHQRLQPAGDGPVRVGRGERVQAGLALPYGKGPERLARDLSVERVTDQAGGAGELAADGHGVAQEAGDGAVALQRQP